MSFLQDLADTESEERDRSFKVNKAARFCHTLDYSINHPQVVGLECVLGGHVRAKKWARAIIRNNRI